MKWTELIRSSRICIDHPVELFSWCFVDVLPSKIGATTVLKTFQLKWKNYPFVQFFLQSLQKTLGIFLWIPISASIWKQRWGLVRTQNFSTQLCTLETVLFLSPPLVSELWQWVNSWNLLAMSSAHEANSAATQYHMSVTAVCPLDFLRGTER